MSVPGSTSPPTGPIRWLQCASWRHFSNAFRPREGTNSADLLATRADAGSGPDWIMPSDRVVTPEFGDTALRARAARSSARRPSPRAAAAAWKLRSDIMIRNLLTQISVMDRDAEARPGHSVYCPRIEIDTGATAIRGACADHYGVRNRRHCLRARGRPVRAARRQARQIVSPWRASPSDRGSPDPMHR
jgi:hypothetical protein